MLAYACNPAGGGEHWLGWGWAEAASQFADVTLYTRAQGAKKIILESAKKSGVRVRFVELPATLTRGSKLLGEAGSWWRKIAWAKRTSLAVAGAAGEFDIIHQTTFHTFRVPFYAAGLGIPSIWGPVGGGENTPAGFHGLLGGSRHQEQRRYWLNKRWLSWGQIQNSLKQARCLFASNQTTLGFLPSFARAKSLVIPPNTLRTGVMERLVRGRKQANKLALIYSGNCVPTRCIPLVLQAMEKCPDTRLTIAGAGPALESWKLLSTRLSDRVTFTGQVSRDRLMQLYSEADALVFPALRDSGGSSLLEAMSIGLPTICFDWGGPAEMVGDDAGIKIPVESPEKTREALTSAFHQLLKHPEMLSGFADRGIVRAQSHFTWEAKSEILEQTCKKLLASS